MISSVSSSLSSKKKERAERQGKPSTPPCFPVVQIALCWINFYTRQLTLHSSVFCSCPVHASERRQYQTFQRGQKRLPSASQQLKSSLYTKTISLNAHRPRLRSGWSRNTVSLSWRDICSASLLLRVMWFPCIPCTHLTPWLGRAAASPPDLAGWVSLAYSAMTPDMWVCEGASGHGLSAGHGTGWAGRTGSICWDAGYPYKALLWVWLWHKTI